MPFFGLSLEELHQYKPERSKPTGFDTFWADTLKETRQHPLNARFEPVNYELNLVKTYDVAFNGYGEQPIKGWFIMSANATEPLPCVV